MSEMTLNYERSYDDSTRKNACICVISKYHKQCASARKGLIMSAHTTYMCLLFVCFNVGFLFNVFVLRANARAILLHALGCAASVMIAEFMPVWMLWASCGMIVASLISTGVIVYKFKLWELHRRKHRVVTEEEVNLEDCPPEVQAHFKKHHG